MSLDIVHPCYNPHADWEKELLLYYNQFMSRIPRDVKTSVYVVNDGSQRGLEQSAIDFLYTNIPNFTFVSYEKNQGKGYALRKAVSETKADLVIYTDADYPYRMENAWEMFELLSKGNYDIVVGVRDNHYYEQLPFMRKVFSLSLKYMNYIFFPKLIVKDTQSGLKGFNRNGKVVFLKTTINAFLFDMEFLVLASRRKDLKIASIPVQVRDGISFSRMSWKTIKAELLNFSQIFSKSE
ncbi:Glycosyl transferase family 2 [Pseudarcicella hirudinis]|uniref:Glycosyl transferase family 2 n=1 Tax=Pseudarcicella hirudinis TaxID=1079859 RepID=A0A1I5QD58_9BACT|nr:glycosyltransferase [Pseudarcicella hirudinis]SFP44047.1 Glycosyl transferase family 2 [Pseudarcicella hirudinis]